MQRSLKVSLFLLLLIPLMASADNVDDYVKTEMQKNHILGLSLAVVKDGKILKAKGYGLANAETNSPSTAETVYKIASVSKQFLVAGILLLVQDGKLHIEDHVSKYLDNVPESWQSITIYHLLTHTSGLPIAPSNLEPFKAQPDSELVKAAYSQPLLFPPGDKISYSNLGYFILAEIIHRVSGKPWSDFLNERLFAPLGMTATRTTTTTDIVPHRSNGYVWNKGKWENAANWIAITQDI